MGGGDWVFSCSGDVSLENENTCNVPIPSRSQSCPPSRLLPLSRREGSGDSLNRQRNNPWGFLLSKISHTPSQSLYNLL